MNRYFLFLLTFSLLLIQRGDLCANNDYSTDTTLVSKLYKECKTVIFNDPNAVNTKIDSMIVISKRNNFKHGLYLAYNLMGVKYYMLSNYPASVKAYFQALEYVEKSDVKQEIRLYSNLSYSYANMGMQDSSMYYMVLINSLSKHHHLDESYNQSLLDLGIYYMSKSDYVQTAGYLIKVDSICKKTSDSVFILKAYSALAQFYQKIENFDKAYYYYHEAIELDEKLSGFDFLSSNTSNIGELFFRLKENYDTAIYFYNRSIELSLPYAKPENKMQAMINIGNVFLEKDDIDSSFYYYSKAYVDTLLETRPVYQAAIFTNLGIYYHEKGNYLKAKEFLTKGLSLSTELDLLDYQRNALNQLWTLEKENNHNGLALQYHIEYLEVLQYIQAQNANNELAIINYERYLVSEKLKNDILISDNSKQKAQLLVHRIIIGVSVFLVLTLIIYLYLFSKKKKEIKVLNQGLRKNYAAITRVNKVLKDQESEMQDLLESKNKFVSILGHDLKNPFSGLLGLLEMMDSDWDIIPEDEKRESIGLLYKTSLQTYQLLEDLLDWGKTQQGLLISNPEKIVINDLILGVFEVFRIQLNKKNLTIEVDVPKDIVVFTDIKLIAQIIQNFIGNAIKYSHNGSKIIIKYSRAPKGHKICVIDQGIGIPVDKIDSLFNFDSNFNRPGTNKEKSTGMGLILCKEYANIIGAKIDVRSEVDKGSAFCLIIAE